MAGSAAFVDGNTSGDDYDYYGDGSQRKDLNKNIRQISYNYLKLPASLTLGTGTSATVVSYGYGASGRKLSQRVTVGSSTTLTEYIGSHVYGGGVLYQMSHAEGRIVPGATAATPVYEWSIRDYLGHLRGSFVEGANSTAQLV